jgi:hypothetical protein
VEKQKKKKKKKKKKTVDRLDPRFWMDPVPEVAPDNPAFPEGTFKTTVIIM